MRPSSRTAAGLIRKLPFVGPRLARLYLAMRSNRRSRAGFAGSARYWQERYAAGGDSGSGSYGRNARFKADVLNALVEQFGIESVLELGCGDGNQLSLATYPRYLGFDVSERAVEVCRERFAADETKSFAPLSDYAGQHADLALSLDVIYHLVEDDAFDAHMSTLFGAADRLAVVFSSNVASTGNEKAHVRHRKFTDWVDSYATNWQLLRQIANPVDSSETSAEFFVFDRPHGPSDT